MTNLFLHLALLLLLALPAGAQSAAFPKRAGGVQDDASKRAAAIIAEAKKLDALCETPEANGLREFLKDARRWQISGVFKDSDPVVLNALYTEGRAVREETHYFSGGKLLLVKVERWWDVDDAGQASEARTRRAYFIENGQVFRQTLVVSSSPPVSKAENKPVSADGLLQRSLTIAAFLLNRDQDSGTLRSLETFAEIGTLQP